MFSTGIGKIGNYVSQFFWQWNNKTTNDSTKSTENNPTFTSRLEKIGYNLFDVPECFNCAVTLTIMDNPQIVNNHPSHVFDECVLNKWLNENPNEDPWRSKINVIDGKKDIKEHTILKNQIE